MNQIPVPLKWIDLNFVFCVGSRELPAYLRDGNRLRVSQRASVKSDESFSSRPELLSTSNSLGFLFEGVQENGRNRGYHAEEAREWGLGPAFNGGQALKGTCPTQNDSGLLGKDVMMISDRMKREKEDAAPERCGEKKVPLISGKTRPHRTEWNNIFQFFHIFGFTFLLRIQHLS